MERERRTKKGRIIQLHGQRAKIACGGDTIDAVLTGKLKMIESDSSPVAVGDYVEYSDSNGVIATVEKIHERGPSISRPAVEKRGFKQILVANVDRIIIVSSIAQPEFNYGIVERFLIIAFKERIQPAVVLNKIDLKNPERVRGFFEAWKGISCETLFTSAVTGEGIDSLAKIMLKGTSVMAGHSGVGKSTLLNCISPGLNLRIGEISSYSHRGIHTTSRVTLLKIADDGWVADTPGLKVLGFSGINKKNLKDYYPEFQERADHCRFQDCRHINEPECAVKESAGVGSGGIAEFRYQNYKRIYDSLKN
jgi:ribosome biogenesis GTPase